MCGALTAPVRGSIIRALAAWNGLNMKAVCLICALGSRGFITLGCGANCALGGGACGRGACGSELFVGCAIVVDA